MRKEKERWKRFERRRQKDWYGRYAVAKEKKMEKNSRGNATSVFGLSCESKRKQSVVEDEIDF
jgi:hypothetical protein